MASRPDLFQKVFSLMDDNKELKQKLALAEAELAKFKKCLHHDDQFGGCTGAYGESKGAVWHKEKTK